MKSRGGLWFGWSGETADGEPGPPALIERQGVTYATIDLPAADHEPLLRRVLQRRAVAAVPLLRRRPALLRRAVRRLRARQSRCSPIASSPLLQHRRPRVGARLPPHPARAGTARSCGVRQPLGFFLHIPFPHVEALRALPVYGELVRNLLAYDLVGVPDASSDLEMLPLGRRRRGRTVRACVPTGASSYGAASRLCRRVPDRRRRGRRSSARRAHSQATETVRRMGAGLLGRRCIIGVDRLDYSKGLVDRFHAYERFMESHAESLRPRDLPADRAAEPRRPAHLCRDPPLARAGGRAHQRHGSPRPTGRRSATSTATTRTRSLMGFLRRRRASAWSRRCATA